VAASKSGEILDGTRLTRRPAILRVTDWCALEIMCVDSS